ncbi:MAG: hypothetical protein E6J67_22945 [Deltaproteobacteria bacterium]|nr:MAG: hypothetical protein E6J67_22945 [Deltaproteobacteria bacterium]
MLWLQGQDLNLRPSGYENPEEGLQAPSDRTNPAESLGSATDVALPLMQAEPTQHKNFGQPVVSDAAVVPPLEDDDESPLTPAQAAARFEIPEYVLRKACAEDRLVHLRVINTLWLAPAAVESFARGWRGKKREH